MNPGEEGALQTCSGVSVHWGGVDINLNPAFDLVSFLNLFAQA